jgi:hypothetical protein
VREDHIRHGTCQSEQPAPVLSDRILGTGGTCIAYSDVQPLFIYRVELGGVSVSRSTNDRAVGYSEKRKKKKSSVCVRAPQNLTARGSSPCARSMYRRPSPPGETAAGSCKQQPDGGGLRDLERSHKFSVERRNRSRNRDHAAERSGGPSESSKPGSAGRVPARSQRPGADPRALSRVLWCRLLWAEGRPVLGMLVTLHTQMDPDAATGGNNASPSPLGPLPQMRPGPQPARPSPSCPRPIDHRCPLATSLPRRSPPRVLCCPYRCICAHYCLAPVVSAQPLRISRRLMCRPNSEPSPSVADFAHADLLRQHNKHHNAPTWTALSWHPPKPSRSATPSETGTLDINPAGLDVCHCDLWGTLKAGDGTPAPIAKKHFPFPLWAIITNHARNETFDSSQARRRAQVVQELAGHV